MRLPLLLAPLLLLSGAAARADELPSGPPAPPPFTERAAFLGLSGAPVAPTGSTTAAASLALEGLGVAWVETLPVRWDALDPHAPDSPVARYDWQRLDDTLAHWQRAGFAPILTVSPASAWASQPGEQTAWAAFVRERLPAADAAVAIRGVTLREPVAAPPQAPYWKEWQRFLRDLFERYDGDGVRDMPGLMRPLQALQILDQVQRPTRWLGSAEEYLRLLHHAREAAAEAGSRCEIVHAAVDLRGLFRADDGKEDLWKGRLESALPATPALVRLEAARGLELVLRSLEMPRLFDALPHVGSGNLSEDVLNLRALRGLLDAYGSTHIPVWLAQSPTRRLGPAHAGLTPPRLPPAEGALRTRSRTEVEREREVEDARYAALADGERLPADEAGPARAWLRRGTAFDLVRGAVLARAAGATRVLTFGPDDSAVAAPGEEGADTGGQGFLRWARGVKGGQAGSGTWMRTASWYAARQLNTLLLGHLDAREVPLGVPGTAVRFTFSDKAAFPWMLVLLPDVEGSWAGEPGQALPTRRAHVPVPAADALVEEVALEEGQPIRRREHVVEGLLSLPVSPAPLYVLPVPSR